MVEQKDVQPLPLNDLFTQGMKLGGKVFKTLPVTFYIVTIAYFVTAFYVARLFIPASFSDMILTFVHLTYAFFTTAYVLQSMLRKTNRSSAEKKGGFYKAIPLLFVASMLYWVLFVIGMAIFIVPGLLFFLYFLLFPSIIVMERKSIFAALKRSARLVRGSLLRVATIYAIFLGAQAFAIMMIAIVELSGSFLLTAFSVAIAHIIILPFQASVLNVLYFDLRAEKEAFDYDVFRYEASRLQTA